MSSLAEWFWGVVVHCTPPRQVSEHGPGRQQAPRDWRSSLREDTRRKLEWIEANTKTSVAIRVDTFGQWMALVEDDAVVRRIRVTDGQWEDAANEAVEWIASRG